MIGCSVCGHMRRQAKARGDRHHSAAHNCTPYILARLDVVRDDLSRGNITDALRALVAR